ncbi:MAG: 16S rRNA (uracil(1498)-N(3))-methyltransferase [Cyanobacteria bacterium SW_9_44_58]|nr:MAG: 16S rRNA (uracil(1498)-N(3))-methyltransferase [Cyanobacteria bacterium SW_9_44_58]
MQYQRFVIEPEQQQGNLIYLNDAQHHYLRRVLRLSAGDRAVAITGKGKAWIVQLTPENAEILTAIEINTELPVTVTLLVSLPKQEVDEIVRCCTEIGVTTIVPVLSERTVLNPSANKLTRWQRIAEEAAEQSERAIVPALMQPLTLPEALSQYDSLQKHCYFCTARHNVPLLAEILPHQLTPQDSLVIATGCEGGWTEQEIRQAQEANFQLVSLGRRILRAVTAPIAVMSLAAAFSEAMTQEP